MRIRERFNPRAPCGARQPQQNEPRMSDLFQPTRPLRGATMPSQMEHSPKGISTHAPLAGRDAKVKSSMRNNLHFNPRAPCGARRSRRGHGDDGRDFNPRAPCGARRSATTPCEWMTAYFNPRAPCGARQRFTAAQAGVNQISTHAPLAGRDRYQQQDQRARQYFNPRAPCGARPRSTSGRCGHEKISTHAPLAGRDFDRENELLAPTRISTHAPLAGRDKLSPDVYRYIKYFNPRAPCGARRNLNHRFRAQLLFQPTRPLRGATLQDISVSPFKIFQPTRPLRGATSVSADSPQAVMVFQPTRPLRGATKHYGSRRRHP